MSVGRRLRLRRVESGSSTVVPHAPPPPFSIGDIVTRLNEDGERVSVSEVLAARRLFVVVSLQYSAKDGTWVVGTAGLGLPSAGGALTTFWEDSHKELYLVGMESLDAYVFSVRSQLAELTALTELLSTMSRVHRRQAERKEMQSKLRARATTSRRGPIEDGEEEEDDEEEEGEPDEIGRW